MKRIISLNIAFILSSFSLTIAQNNNKLGVWYMYFGNAKVSNKVSIHNEFQTRHFSLKGNTQQTLLRLGLDYRANKRIYSAGYAFIHSNFNDDNNITIENRIWQQYIYRHDVFSLNFTHRFRTEQRFIDADFSQRIRYLLGFQFPLNKVLMSEKHLFFVACNSEIMLDFDNDMFNQIRFYCALGYKIRENVSIQSGYLRWILPHKLAYNRLQLAIFWNLDLLKKTA